MLEQKIGRYALTSKLGHGGMGEVFLAVERHAKSVEQVVIKRILPQNAANPDYKKMFLSEMVLIARFRHDNIVALKDHGYDGEYYIVLEYVGPDLGEIIRRARDTGVRIPPALCARMISMACDGLHYIHQQRIVHYDISPENLAISRTGIVKVLDFGISRTEEQNAPASGRTPRKKLAYMAPERVRDGRADWRSDIYALGVLLYELLSGCRPYEREDEVDEDKDPFKESERRQRLKLRITNKEPLTALRDLHPHIPEELERIVERALAAEPEARYQSCHELGMELERFVASTRPAVTPADLPELVERLYPRSLTALPAPDSARASAEVVTEPPSPLAQKETGNAPDKRGSSFAELALSLKHPWQVLPFAIGVLADLVATKWHMLLACIGMYLAFRLFDKRQDANVQKQHDANMPNQAGNVAGAKVSLKLPSIVGNVLPGLVQVALPFALGAVVAEGAKTIKLLYWPSASPSSAVVRTETQSHPASNPLPDPLLQQISESSKEESAAAPPPAPSPAVRPEPGPPPPPAKVRFALNTEHRSLKYCNIRGVAGRVNPGDLVLVGSKVECSYSCEDDVGNDMPRTVSLMIGTSRRQNLPCQ